MEIILVDFDLKLEKRIVSLLPTDVESTICKSIDELKELNTTKHLFFVMYSKDSIHYISYLEKTNKNYVILYNSNDISDKDSKEISSYGNLNEGSVDIIDISTNDDLLGMDLKKTLKRFFQTNEKIVDENMVQQVEELTQYSVGQLERIKRIHEAVVPLRSEELKGLKLYSKYAAGVKSGGEFYDILKTENEIVLFVSSSSSYIVSSIILSHFEAIKSLTHFSDEVMENFLKGVHQEISTLQFKKPTEKDLDLILLRFNLRTMSVDGHNFGETHFISNFNQHLFLSNDLKVVPENFKKASISQMLDRGEKIIVLSPGFLKNCNDVINGMEIDDFIESIIHNEPREILTELFYQLKKDMAASFLDYDATAIVIEVDQNVIVQV
ncbi:MAG: hypothetical protein H6622_10600 [Halobacteriovoraceae bacterium]|nr:hypothetical protein [Halobacteriovoraceae bacterium]